MKQYEDPPAEIFHPEHPAHDLKLVTAGVTFVCDGCKEPGDGARYTCGGGGCCGSTSFDLHPPCALADEDGALRHPMFAGRDFFFLPAPPPPVDKTICDACGEPVRGYVHHCFEEGEHGLDIHPCCWTLQPTITVHGAAFELCNDKQASSRHCAFCGEKGRRSKFWAYRWYNANDGRHVYLHVACVKNAARRTWDEAYHKRVGSGGGVVQASMPAIEAAVQQSLVSRNARSSSRSGFDRVMKIITTVAQIVIAAIFGNPIAMIGALVGPGGFFRDY
ncbi:unnamed protein product [Urochloa humidicola]